MSGQCASMSLINRGQLQRRAFLAAQPAQGHPTVRHDQVMGVINLRFPVGWVSFPY
jgi:hypothetical protein